jgi:hypothetical protein
MPYLVKQTVTAKNVNGDTFVHPAGTVLSDWELSDFIKEKVKTGEAWYRASFEPLLEREAHQLRVKVTAEQGDREVDGVTVMPPFDDYIGLHPAEIVERMKTATLEKVRQVKLFERGGMNRGVITDYVSPSEREPFAGYEQMALGDILEKFSILSEPQVQEAKMYEQAHKQRPVILEYERAAFEGDPAIAAKSPAVSLPVEPDPGPPQLAAPMAPAPPMASEGAQPTTTQADSQQQVAVTPPPAPPVPAMSAPPS